MNIVIERERPLIPNRAENIVLIGQNMMIFYELIGRWHRASERAVEEPNEKNQERFKKLDEQVRKILSILPELQEQND